MGSDGKVTGLKLQRCASVFDEAGPFRPDKFDDSTFSETDADYVIIAIGQRSDFSFLAEDDPLVGRV